MNNEEKILSMLGKIDNRLGNVEKDIKVMKEDIKFLKEDSISHRAQTKENTQILNALRYASDEMNAKMHSLELTTAEIKGENVGLKEDFSTI